MTKSDDRNERLKRLRWRYEQRGKAGKSRLLDEFCDHYGYERKYAIKLLNEALGTSSERKPPPGPQPKYEPVLAVVSEIWRAAEQLCGKRLARALPLWLPHYEKHYGKLLPLSDLISTTAANGSIGRSFGICRCVRGPSG